MAKKRTPQSESLKDWQGFYDEFQRESPRAAVIVGHAFLDARLGELLANFLIDDETKVKRVLGVGGLFGSFFARTTAAYVLGLISKRAYEELNTINWIRNRFAHEIHGLTFEDEAIAARCRDLKWPTGHYDIPGVDIEPSLRDMYVSTVVTLSNLIAIHALGIKSERWLEPLTFPVKSVINEDP